MTGSAIRLLQTVERKMQYEKKTSRGMNMKQNRNPKRKQRFLGVLMIVMALIIMQLPVSEVDAAASTSDFRMNGSTLVKYRGADKNVTLPDTVEVIGRGAFEDNTNIELVVVPNSVKRIDPYAFWGCDHLDTVVLGKGLTDVGDYAFAGCKGLEQMTIPSNITTIGIEAFADCINMKDISIPRETVRIHETAFDGCCSLTIHCDDGSVASDFAEEFYERQKEMPGYEDETDNNSSNSDSPNSTPAPTQVPVTESVVGTTQIVGNRAVFLLGSQSMQVYEGSPQEEITDRPIAELMGNGTIPKYTIIDGEIVADQAYYNGTGIGNVVLPEGIKEIGQFAFARSSVTGISMPQGVEQIDYGAFYHCDALEIVSLPDTVRCVEPKAFSYTPWVQNFLKGTSGNDDFLISGGVLIAYRGNKQSVVIPEGVRVIAAEAFWKHTEIRSVSLPDSLLVVGEGAFEGCNQLKRIVFGRNVEEIKDRAFSGINTTLSSVTLPASVKKLGLRAFDDIAIRYEGEEPEHTYETSASRLSNSEYRNYDSMESPVSGVNVRGMEGASASLEEADRVYTLNIDTLQESSTMETACMRSFRESLPDGHVLYRLVLTDESNIPLTILGSQILTVVMPAPESLGGQRLRLLALDRNGQLEDIPVERVLVDGNESIRFQVNYVSEFALYGTGAAGSGDLSQEIQVTMNQQASAPGRLSAEGQLLNHQDSTDAVWRSPAMWVGCAMLITGFILLLSGSRKRKV